ncbi:MAG TPA: hypothetical protein VG986_03835 [Pseudolabrys sp.]|nr:hypothetical protein [Pseudolabrys sp.]
MTFVGAGALLAGMLAWAAAGSRTVEPAPAAPAPAVAMLAGADILASLRQIGLNPIGEPVLRGPYYVMHAYDPRGIEMRVVVDAQFGDVLSVSPARPLNTVYAPQYERAPRIIHVPPRTGPDSGATSDDSVPPASVEDDDDASVAPDKPGAGKTKKLPKGAQAPDKHRAVLSAPPAAETPPAPINPADRFEPPADKGEKSAPPPPAAPPKTTP